MKKSNQEKHLHIARVYGSLTKNYMLLKEIDPNQHYEEQDMVMFQSALLFGIVHQN